MPQTSVSLVTRVFLEGAIQFGATESLVGFSPRLSTLCPAKCAQLLVSIKQRHPEDQDAEGFQKVLHFGSVAVGCTAERQIKLYNPSAVRVLCMWGAWGRGLGPQARVHLIHPSPVLHAASLAYLRLLIHLC